MPDNYAVTLVTKSVRISIYFLNFTLEIQFQNIIFEMHKENMVLFLSETVHIKYLILLEKKILRFFYCDSTAIDVSWRIRELPDGLILTNIDVVCQFRPIFSAKHNQLFFNPEY